MIYIAVILLLLVLIYHFDIKGNRVNRGFYYDLVFVALMMIAGMRYLLGADTANYLYHFYHDIPYLWDLTIEDFAWDSEPLWKLMNSLVLSMGGRWYIIQFVQAAYVNYLLLRYFKKHSKYIFSCVFFYFIWMYTYYVMEEMRASMSVVLCLYGNDYFLEKKWGKGYLLLFIGCLFHKSTYALLITPLLIWLMQSNFIAFGVIVAAFVISYILKSQLSDYLDLFTFSESIDNKVQGYATSDIYGEKNGNINFFLVKVFPFLFYPLLSLYYNRNNNNSNKDILYLKPLLLIGFIFVVIRFNIEIFYRYVHFYMAYIIIFVSQLYIDLMRYKKEGLIYDKTISSAITLIKVFVLIFPLFVFNAKSYQSLYVRYYPYSSIIEHSITPDRMKAYIREGVRILGSNSY